MNNSFTEQLNCIHSLQQIASLHAAKEHLPKDIITILERLGRVDNTPFDKLYYLAENCTDHYYTSVIKTVMEIIKWSVTDHQIVLVNMARALKYLEDFGQRQSWLFKVLEKYHLPLDNFKNLLCQFGFLKQATSKNVEQLQQAINVQQTCTATICMYINSILPCIMKLEQTILQLQQKITMEQDTVKINTLDFDPDIDGTLPPRSCTNTVVVSIQKHFTTLEQRFWMPQIPKQKTIQLESHLNLSTTILKSPMGMMISPKTFKITQQNRTRSPQNTALIQKKNLN